MMALGIPILAVVLLDASAFETSLLVASASSAPLVFGLSAGVFADRVNRRRLIFACALAQAALSIILGAFYAFDCLNLQVLMLGAFAASAIKLLLDSATVAAIPALVAESELSKANGWYEAVNSSTQAAGPILCGWLIQSVSLLALFITQCFACVLSASIFVRLPVDSNQAVHVRTEGHLAGIREGMAVLWRDPVLRAIAVSSASFNFFHSAFFAIFTVYAIKTLDFSPATLGLIISCAGIAGVGGALLASVVVRVLTPPVALIGSLFVIAPMGIPLMFADSLGEFQGAVLIAAIFAAWDFAIVTNLVIEQTVRQTRVCSSQLSCVSATTRFFTWGVDPLGALLGGIAASSTLGLEGTLIAAVLGMGASGLVLFVCPAVRRLSFAQA
ncbi:MFS transporter [Pararobbsia alpina]|nr:MFS transporter [Pararobbsia alpina]